MNTAMGFLWVVLLAAGNIALLLLASSGINTVAWFVGVMGLLAVWHFISFRTLIADAVVILIGAILLSFGLRYPSLAPAFVLLLGVQLFARLGRHLAQHPERGARGKLGLLHGSKAIQQEARKAFKQRPLQRGTFTARWADAADLAQADMYIEKSDRFERNIALAAPSAGLLIGVKEGHAGRRELGHFAVFGATRAGKGRLLTANAIMWPESLVVLDIKGENYKLTAGDRAAYSRVLTLHPNGRGNQYDPFAEMQGSLEGMRTAASIIIDASQDKQPVFGQAAENALYAAFLGARLEGAPTLPYVQALLDQGIMGFVEHLAKLNDQVVNRALTQFLNVRPSEFTLESFDRSSGLLRGAWGTLNTRCSAFMTEGILSMMGGSDFTAADLYDENTSLYLIFPESEAAATSKAFQIILISLVNSLIRTYDERDAVGAKPERQILWLLDEAGRTPIPHLDDYIATVAGRGMIFGLFVQDIPQLMSNYQISERTVRSNIRTQVFYTPTEETTQRHVEQRLGQVSLLWEREVGGEVFTVGDIPVMATRPEKEVVRESNRPLMTSSELSMMSLDHVIVFAAAVPPIYSRRVEPFEIFTDLSDAAPAAPLTPLPPVLYTLSASSSDQQQVQRGSPGQREASKPISESRVISRKRFTHETVAATVALQARGGNVSMLELIKRAVLDGGTPCAVFSDGHHRVMICEENEHFFEVDEDSTKLDSARVLEADVELVSDFDDIDADLNSNANGSGSSQV